MNNPTLLLTADWHIRSDTPENRKDNFLEVQEGKVDFILQISTKYQIPIVIAGDIGHIPHWENWLLEKYISKFKSHSQKIYCIPGQHDLPYHRLDKLKESGIGVLNASQSIILLYAGKGYKLEGITNTYVSKKICIIHQLISQKKLWKTQENFTSAESVLKNNPYYDLIVSGDNHQSFTERYKERLLVNPGSIMRSTIAQLDHKPKIYLWYAKENYTKEVEIPINPSKEVFDLSIIEKDKSSEKKILSFIKTLGMDYELKMNFRKNLELFFVNNKISKRIKEKIFKALR